MSRAARELLAPLLAPLALGYAAVIRLRNGYYRARRGAARHVGVPVVSVGNLTVGGTGKTPLVIEIAGRLATRGRRPAVLTRGYGGSPAQPADEVLELREALPDVPIVVDPDRVAGAAAARRDHGADCLVLDDGFQHRRIARALDVVALDLLDPFGGGVLLPCGRLREPPTALRRADLIVLTRVNLTGDEGRALAAVERVLEDLAVRAPRLTAAVVASQLRDGSGATRAPEALRGLAVLPVCGLGNPEGFLRLLRSIGAEVRGGLVFGDHHRYRAGDLRAIRRAAARRRVEAVVTTRKDWVKLWPLLASGAAGDGPPLLRLDARLVPLDPAGLLDRLLDDALGQREAQRGCRTGGPLAVADEVDPRAGPQG